MVLSVFAAKQTPVVKSPAEMKAEADEGQFLSCQLYGQDDFTHFNLTALGRSNPLDYQKDGVEFKVCEYLERSDYYARVLSMKTGTTILTNSNYAPDHVQVVKDGD